MTFEALNDEQSGAVVGTSRIGVSQAAKWLICLVIALMCALWITPCAFAEGEGTLTENITDPQNLLGSNVSAVTDKIKETKQQSGVTVRLLYVESFGTEVNPTKWASGVLESLSPKPNTVLLAVASGDGKLVVVASGNSEDWLRNSKTMDALSEAATDKLAKSGAQDWSGAAIAMMDQIMLLKKTSTSGSLSKIAVIVLMCVVVVLIVGTIVFVVLRNRRRRKEAELDAARAAAGKRTRANRRGHAVGHAAESASRSRGRRGEEHGRGRRGKRSDESVESADVAKSVAKSDAPADDSAKFMPVSDQVEQSEMAGLTESTGPAESTEPVEPTGQPVAQRMEFPEATPEAGAAGRTETQPVETPAGDESEPKKHSGFHLFGKGGKGGKGGAKGASAEPLFHAGDSFMPGDGSVDQSVSDDIESMFARPFIPGTQRPSGENNENDENKD
ncbi:TPM domain-containing protein [Bifidobacterium angulatum]|uniref:TPM domain-containing protein n=1 Tax=Bifidobacterium angulatum TaxID=1683 RepID=UPI003AAEEBAE